jgi:hypothetical protein
MPPGFSSSSALPGFKITPLSAIPPPGSLPSASSHGTASVWCHAAFLTAIHNLQAVLNLTRAGVVGRRLAPSLSILAHQLSDPGLCPAAKLTGLYRKASMST